MNTSSLSIPCGWRDADEPTSPAFARARTRVVLLCLAVGIWCLPFIGDLTGADRTGAAGALALAAGFGLAAAALLARTRRDLLCGEAVTSLAFAGLVLVLVATAHPWVPGPDRRAVLVPIFGPLALLALLDFVTRVRRVAVGIEVGVVRMACALVAAIACALARDGVAAGAALFLAMLPAAAALPVTARTARRALEGASFVAAVGLFLAPELHDALAPPSIALAAPTVWAFLHRLAGIGLGILAGVGIASPEGEASDSGPVANS